MTPSPISRSVNRANAEYGLELLILVQKTRLPPLKQQRRQISQRKVFQRENRLLAVPLLQLLPSTRMSHVQQSHRKSELPNRTTIHHPRLLRGERAVNQPPQLYRQIMVFRLQILLVKTRRWQRPFPNNRLARKNFSLIVNLYLPMQLLLPQKFSKNNSKKSSNSNSLPI